MLVLHGLVFIISVSCLSLLANQIWLAGGTTWSLLSCSILVASATVKSSLTPDLITILKHFAIEQSTFHPQLTVRDGGVDLAKIAKSCRSYVESDSERVIL
jgi:hypothetical protein